MKFELWLITLNCRKNQKLETQIISLNLNKRKIKLGWFFKPSLKVTIKKKEETNININ